MLVTTSSKIEEIKRQRQQEVKLKKNQKKYFYLVALISLIIFGYLIDNNTIYAFTWIIGIIIGITMQRSRFCFAASFRDPIMVGTTSLFRAVILGLMISTIGFGIYQYIFFSNLESYSIMDIPGQIYPVGIHTVIGAIIFGIGMVIAGGCATGTLIRIGEGYLMQVIVFIGFIIGATLGGRSFGFWDKLFISSSRIIYIPEYIGLIPTILSQLIILVIIYYLAIWYDKKNSIMADL